MVVTIAGRKSGFANLFRATPLGVMLVAIIMVSRSLAGDNLLSNGDFAAGSGDRPLDWRARVNLATTQYSWTPPADGNPGLVEIANLTPNDSRWIHSLHLGPGWYYISAEVMTEDVWTDAIGACVGLTDPTVRSAVMSGNQDWTRLGFYLQVGAGGADVEVNLRLGDFSHFTPGRAFFRGASVVPIDSPPADKANEPLEFHLDEIRGFQAGSPWSLVLLFGLLLAGGLIGWRLFDASPGRVSGLWKGFRS